MSVLSFRVSTGVRKAAAVIQNSISSEGPPQLYMVGLQEKLFSEALEGACSSKEQATSSLAKWAEQENNLPVRELYLKLSQIDELAMVLHRNYIAEHEAYRKNYKHILEGEKQLDKTRKQVEISRNKVAKINKQVAESQKKSSSGKVDKKLEALFVDLQKATEVLDINTDELRELELNHEHFKFKRVKQAIACLSEANATLHDGGLKIAEAQKKLLDMYTSVPFMKITPAIMSQAQTDSNRLVEELAQELKTEINGPIQTSQNESDDDSSDPQERCQNLSDVPIPAERNYRSPEQPRSRPLPAIPVDLNEYSGDETAEYATPGDYLDMATQPLSEYVQLTTGIEADTGQEYEAMFAGACIPFTQLISGFALVIIPMITLLCAGFICSKQ